MHRLLLALLLLVSPASAEQPSADERIRQAIRTLTIPRFDASVADGPALASALQETLRKEPGSQTMNVLWTGKESKPISGGPIRFDIQRMLARDLLSATCRKAGVFWGIRDGMIVLSGEAILRTVSLPVDPTLMTYLSTTSVKETQRLKERDNSDNEVTEMLIELLPHVEWRGTERLKVKYQPEMGTIFFTTSEEHMPAVKRLALRLNIQVRTVQISATWVAYPPARVEAALSASPTAVLSQTELRKMFAEGEKRILQAQTVVTLSGINAVTESVEEIIYPTEFDVTEEDVEVSKGGGGPENKAHFSGPLQMPGAFETREIGALFNVTPTVNPDNETINLQLLPEIADLERWIEYARDASLPLPASPPAHMPQPVFGSHNVTTSVSLKSGSTLVLSGGREPKTKEYVYLYVNAELLDTEGTPMHSNEGFSYP